MTARASTDPFPFRNHRTVGEVWADQRVVVDTVIQELDMESRKRALSERESRKLERLIQEQRRLAA